MGTPPNKPFAFGMLLLAGFLIVVLGGLWLVGGEPLLAALDPLALGFFLTFGFLIVVVGGSWLVKTCRKHFL
jgi:hypothetical protein